jgi:hypothetical protein
MLTFVIAPAARANCEHGALLGLFLGGVGNHETRGSALLGCVGLDDNAIVEWLQVHFLTSVFRNFRNIPAPKTGI